MAGFPTNYGVLWLALAFYGASLIYAVWRLALGSPHRRWPKLVLVAPGFVLHTLYLWERGLSQGRCPVSNLFETLTFITWCLVALHLIVTLSRQVNYLTVFYMPLVLAVQLTALIAPTDSPHFDRWKEAYWLGFHASVIMLGYAAFTLAGAVAAMYLFQERQLRTRRLRSSFMLLPPILRLELLQGWLIVSGFSLLSLGLLSGMIGLGALKLDFSKMDAKLLWSLLVWIMYMALLAARFGWGMNGRWMSRWSIIGCIFVLTTFWLANTWSHFHRF